jgi:hypothetical protein
MEVFGVGAAAVSKLTIKMDRARTEKDLFILASLVRCNFSVQQNLIR